MSTPLILNEEKLDIADLPGQPSVGCLVLTGCPIVGTELHESEAEFSVTPLTGGDAVGDSNSQLLSQHLALINTNTLSEANSPGANIETACQCSPEVIDGELTALQASSQSDGTGRVLGMDSRGFENERMTRVRTCRRIPVILDWKGSDVGRTDPKEMEMSDVVTSMHSSRCDSAQGERSLKRKVNGKTAVSEASGRKQDSMSVGLYHMGSQKKPSELSRVGMLEQRVENKMMKR